MSDPGKRALATVKQEITIWFRGFSWDMKKVYAFLPMGFARQSVSPFKGDMTRNGVPFRLTSLQDVFALQNPKVMAAAHKTKSRIRMPCREACFSENAHLNGIKTITSEMGSNSLLGYWSDMFRTGKKGSKYQQRGSPIPPVPKFALGHEQTSCFLAVGLHKTTINRSFPQCSYS